MCVRKFAGVCIAMLLVVLPMRGLRAQSVADDIQQLVFDVQKLSQLKQILTETYQEYQMLYKQYEQIKSLSQGTFSLHKVFLDGLLLVSPGVRSYYKIADVFEKETRLAGECQSGNAYFSGSGLFTAQELEGFSTNYSTYLQRSQRDAD